MLALLCRLQVRADNSCVDRSSANIGIGFGQASRLKFCVSKVYAERVEDVGDTVHSEMWGAFW